MGECSSRRRVNIKGAIDCYLCIPLPFFSLPFLIKENRGENGGAQGSIQRPRLASVPSRAEDAVDQLQENEKLIAGTFVFLFFVLVRVPRLVRP